MKYLIYNTESEASERSLQEALNRGASPSTVTRYWWSWRQTNDDKFALCIPNDEIFLLSDLEQSALVDSVVFKSQDGV